MLSKLKRFSGGLRFMLSGTFSNVRAKLTRDRE